MMKIYICLIIAIMLILVGCNKNPTYDKKLTDEQVVQIINKVAQRYTTKNVSSKITSDKRYLRLNELDITDKEFNGNTKHIDISGGDNTWTHNYQPVQIYAIFECFLLLKDKELSFELFGIYWAYSSGGIDNTLKISTLIKESEFDELYDTTNLEGLSSKQAAKKLSDKWIEQTGYVKQ